MRPRDPGKHGHAPDGRRFLDGLDALDGHVPETCRRLIVERVYETLKPLDP
jgi:hypothetical protein